MALNILIIIACILLDQVTKFLAIKYLMPVGSFPLIENILHLTYVENRGAAFGMLADHRWVFMILSTVGIAAVFIYLAKTKPESWWARLGLTFIIGGGIGNMIDRVARGYVVDFIDCRFIDFYVFNGADSFVCVGAVLFLIAVIIDEVRENRKKSSAAEGVGGKDSGDGAK